MDPDLRSFQQSMALAGIGKRQQNPSYSRVAAAPVPSRQAFHSASSAPPPKRPEVQSDQPSTSQQKVPLFVLSDSEQEDEDRLKVEMLDWYNALSEEKEGLEVVKELETELGKVREEVRNSRRFFLGDDSMFMDCLF